MLTFEARLRPRLPFVQIGLHSPRDLHAFFEDTVSVHAVLPAPLQRAGTRPSAAPESSGLPLLGFPKIAPPPIQEPVVLSREPHPKMLLLRHEVATPRARAALVVSHDFDGLLQRVPCRSVAPCNRSWGSPRCWLGCPCPTLVRCRSITSRGSVVAFPVAPYPAKPSPRHQLCVVSPRPIPSRRYSRCSLTMGRCCHLPVDRSHASARPQGLVPMPSPLPSPGVATWRRLDAPMGLFPQSDAQILLLGPAPARGSESGERLHVARLGCASEEVLLRPVTLGRSCWT
jgi:hypothetical protein